MITMNRKSSGTVGHPSPYVWIKSHRLRNPHNLTKPPGLDGESHIQGRTCFNSNTASKAKNNKHMIVDPRRISSTTSGGTGGRMVKTADSNDLFQTGIEPAYIDHKGDLIHTSAVDHPTGIDETSGPRKRQERPRSCRSGWGVMLLPPAPEM
ncbi:hypothetical protein EGW08_018202, partial [Elysia chlorotica]